MELPPSCLERVREIHRATRAMVARIAALQRFSKLAAGELRTEQVDLSAIAAEIAQRLGANGAKRLVTFNIEEGVTATGDKKLLRFAMEQLLENAWDSTSGVPPPMIRFGTAEVGGERSFFVSDNGPRRQDQQPQRERCRQGAGDGLDCGIGLATVQRIISLHRGRIWAADQAGTGATFYFQV